MNEPVKIVEPPRHPGLEFGEIENADPSEKYVSLPLDGKEFRCRVYFPRELWNSWSPERQEKAKAEINEAWECHVNSFFDPTVSPESYSHLILKWVKEEGA